VISRVFARCFFVFSAPSAPAWRALALRAAAFLAHVNDRAVHAGADAENCQPLDLGRFRRTTSLRPSRRTQVVRRIVQNRGGLSKTDDDMFRHSLHERRRRCRSRVLVIVGFAMKTRAIPRGDGGRACLRVVLYIRIRHFDP